MKRTGIKVWDDIVLPKLPTIAAWVADGLNLAAIADKLKVSRSKLWELAQEQEELKKALSYEGIPTANVENSLYMKCIGFDHTFEKATKIKEEYYDEQGRKCSKERLVKTFETIYIPPDVNAQKFWLLNHAATRYKRDQPEMNITSELLDKADSVLVKIRDKALAGD